MRKAVELAEVDQSLEQEIGRNTLELRNGGPTAPRQKIAKTSADDLGTLFRQMTDRSTREIDTLIEVLHGLRRKLENESDLIERAIARHSQFSQGTLQLATIIADNVKRLPHPSS